MINNEFIFKALLLFPRNYFHILFNMRYFFNYFIVLSSFHSHSLYFINKISFVYLLLFPTLFLKFSFKKNFLFHY